MTDEQEEMIAAIARAAFMAALEMSASDQIHLECLRRVRDHIDAGILSVAERLGDHER